MLRLTMFAAGLLLSANVFALSLSDLSQQDASGGLKDALIQGAQVAVKQLGTPGGFSNNPDVRIELPGKLGKAAKTMKMMGMGAQVDQLEASMNKAAEAARSALHAALGDTPDVAVYAGPVVSAGEVELLPFLHEQAVSVTAHRFGTPDHLTEGVL